MVSLNAVREEAAKQLLVVDRAGKPPATDDTFQASINPSLQRHCYFIPFTGGHTLRSPCEQCTQRLIGRPCRDVARFARFAGNQT